MNKQCLFIIPFIIFIFCRLKILHQKMEGNPNLSCSGPPSLIGPACFLRHSFLLQTPKQLEEMTNAPSVVPWLAERTRPLVPWLPIKPLPADIEPDSFAHSGEVRRHHIPPVQLWLGGHTFCQVRSTLFLHFSQISLKFYKEPKAVLRVLHPRGCRPSSGRSSQPNRGAEQDPRLLQPDDDL